MSEAYAELAVTTNFSFLRGASHPRELVAAASLLGLSAIGIADHNSLAGVVRTFDALNQIEGKKPKLLVGSRLIFADGTPDILAYPADRAAYGRLCRLISEGKQRAKKGDCLLYRNDLLAWQEGLLLAVVASSSFASLTHHGRPPSRPPSGLASASPKKPCCNAAWPIAIHRADAR
jgi:error-prone DNA polymerase